jgi:hypothetical protein
MTNLSESNPVTPATRSGKKYVQLSTDEGGERRGSKPPVKIPIPGALSARKSAQAPEEKKSARRNTTSGASSAQVTGETAEEDPTTPSELVEFEDHGLVVIFGEMLVEKCLLSKGTMLKMAELLDHQHRKKIHPHDVTIERRLLADKVDKLL